MQMHSYVEASKQNGALHHWCTAQMHRLNQGGDLGHRRAPGTGHRLKLHVPKSMPSLVATAMPSWIGLWSEAQVRRRHQRPTGSGLSGSSGDTDNLAAWTVLKCPTFRKGRVEEGPS